MKYLIIILLSLIALIACNDADKGYMPIEDFTDNSKGISYGNHQDVYVFSNQVLGENTLDIMKQQFGYPQEGAQKERTFEMFMESFSDFEEFKKAKNIIFICNLDRQDEITSFVVSKISQDKLDYVLNIGPTIVTYQNEWSDDQLVTFILSPNENKTDDIIISKMPNLYLDYENRFLKRMTRRVYYRGVLDNNIFQDYGYSLQIPSTFQLYKEDKTDNMLSFIYRYKKKDTILPDKYLTLYTEEMSRDDFDELWVKKGREKLGNVMLDGDKIDWMRTNLLPKTFTTWKDIKYNGFILEGAWENEENNMGGSFKSYAFYDEVSKSAYLIDTAVYYPAGTKIPYLVELEGIVKSFNIKE